MNDTIKITGAREHNLQNINLEIPKNKLVVFTGLSGSGKSTLAFDTLYAEGQRRYIETFDAYARQFLGGLERPDVDKEKLCVYGISGGGTVTAPLCPDGNAAFVRHGGHIPAPIHSLSN